MIVVIVYYTSNVQVPGHPVT